MSGFSRTGARSPDPVLIIPAAGSGSRLKSSTAKVLTPVNDRPMIDHLFDLYRRKARRFVLVVNPTFERAVREHCRNVASDLDVAYAVQPSPTGMLDAILLAAHETAGVSPSRIWITWCDQIAIHPQTIATLSRLSTEDVEADLIFPTAWQVNPYIHLVRDGGRIVANRQRREGDEMPDVGESDAGLFSLSMDAFFSLLPRFAGEASEAAATRERNFLPFVPWLVHRGARVVTFPCVDEAEAVGVNTPEDQRFIEHYLRTRGDQ